MTSFNVYVAPAAMLLHVPGELISTMPLLVAPLAPACPPLATMYATDVPSGQSYPGTLKLPVLSVVSGAERACVGAEPLPVVPAAYICTLAPTTGVLPAITLPENAAPV